MLKIKTESGSLYLIDKENKRISRDGKEYGGDRATKEWRQYKELARCEVGHPLVIMWTNDVPLLEGSPSDADPATITSNVISIEELSE